MFIFGPAPGALGRGQKVKYFQFPISKSILKIFMRKCAHILSSDICKTYWTGFTLWPQEHPLGWDLGGGGGVGGQKLSFSQHGHVAYQIEGNDE